MPTSWHRCLPGPPPTQPCVAAMARAGLPGCTLLSDLAGCDLWLSLELFIFKNLLTSRILPPTEEQAEGSWWLHICPAVIRRAQPVPACRAMPCHAMLCHAMPCHSVPCHAVPCHAMPCYAMLCHAMPCHAVPCCVMPFCAMLCHSVPCCAMSCRAMPCHAMPCHAVPCRACWPGSGRAGAPRPALRASDGAAPCSHAPLSC